ncbi:MAG: restriction endonuclease subunit S [Oscillospiraceae bacterium]|nr:restriction endonuclease subunit S [Oscillospiraceae bacterium]
MMTAEQLKCSIYQQIFSGKLTQQLREDGSTKALIDSIEKTVPKTTKIARIEKQEDGLYYERLGNKKVLISDELPFDIPDNWEWVHLNKVAVSGLGKTLNKSKDTGETKQYLCSINVYWDGIHLEEVKKAKFSDTDIVKYKLQKGDLLICEGGDAGRTAIWNNDTEMYYQNALHRVRFYEGIDPYYFCALMEFYKLNGTIDSYCKGMTIKHLVQGSLNAMYFPLPPLAEQKRIVAKIEELMPFVDQYAAASTKLNTLNTTFPDMMKKSILQEAVQGKLVPQDLNDEPASVLLKKIAEEKKRLIKEGKIKKQKPLPEITEDEIPFDIPESWKWVRLSDISKQITDGEHSTPRRVSEYCGFYLLSARNVRDSEIKLDDVDFVDSSEFERISSRCNPVKGDVLISCSGSVGRCAVVNDDNKYVMVRSAAMASPIMCDSNYLMYSIQSDCVQRQINALKKQTAQANLFLGAISFLKIPLPPYHEQKRIVNRLKQILNHTEKAFNTLSFE